MSPFKRYLLLLMLIGVGIGIFRPRPIIAAPSFFIDGTSSGVFKQVTTWDLKLNTDGQLITAAQTVIEFDKELFNQVQVSNLRSRCSFWAPPDPSLNLGNSVTPYFLNGEKIVVACGFSNPGYNTTNGIGDLILSFSLEPYYLGSASFLLSNSQLRFVDAVIIPAESTIFDYTVISSEAATPAPTPVPTPTPVPPTPTTLRVGDLSLVDIMATRSGSSALNRSNAATASMSAAEAAAYAASQLDNTIPPPPADMEQRPPATPYPQLTQNQLDSADNGEVLSIQSLRELLIPGKSDADRRLVVFNLIALLIFLLLLAMLVWRLIMAKRTHDLKIKHMNELIEGELSVIQGKVQAVKEGQGSSDDVVRSLEELKRELDEKEKSL